MARHPHSSYYMVKSVEFENNNDVGALPKDLGVRPPDPYDFAGWPAFKTSLLRYHSAMFPDEDGVSGRIAAFRSFMSPQVIEYLTSMRPEIFNDGEFQDWNQWLMTVTRLLRPRDRILENAVISDMPPISAEGLVQQYYQGMISERDFWFELADLVDRNVISAYQQIQIFWEAHSHEDQVELADRCPHFDPGDQVWSENAPKADRVRALWMLNEPIVLISKKEAQESRNAAIIYGLFTIVSFILAIVLFSLLAIPKIRTPRNKAFKPIVVVGSTSGFCILAFSTFACIHWSASRSFAKRRKYYHRGVQSTS